MKPAGFFALLRMTPKFTRICVSSYNMAGNPAFNVMDLGQAFARAYNLGILPTGGEATDMDQCRQYAARLAAELKPHFSTALATIAASDDAVATFNAQGLAGVNFPDLVTAGLVTAESAKSLEEAVAKQAQTMVDSAVSVFRDGSRWFSLSRLIPRVVAYGLGGFIEGILAKRLLGTSDYTPVFGLCLIGVCVEVAGWLSMDIFGPNGTNGRQHDAARTALVGLRTAFPTVFAEEKKAAGNGGPA